MGISFKDSVKKYTVNTEVTSVPQEINGTENDNIGLTNIIAPMSPMSLDYVADDESNMIAAYAGDSWSISNKYLYYPEYNDDSMSIIDEEKNIILNQKQINLTQESNSQFIPFEMNRYYDGFDLLNTNILIHFVNKEGFEDYATPINVYYDSLHIKFGWLVDKRVTAIEGVVKFEIHAVGVNSKGDEYIWKSKPTDKLNILKSLSGNGVIKPDETWITSFLTQVTEQVSLAQEAAQKAEDSISTVASYAQQASNFAQEAKEVVNDAKIELENTVKAEITNQIATTLSDYYTQVEVDDIVTGISNEIDGLENQINNIDGLAAFKVEYNGSVMTFYNGETIIKEIPINSDPTTEWTTAYTAIVDNKISTAKTEVQNDLDAYKEIVNADLEGIHADIDGLPETLANDYYTKEVSDNTFATKANLTATNQKVANVESSANTNKENISTLNTKMASLQEEVDKIDKTPRLTYEATYDENQQYTLWEIQEKENGEEERTAKGSFKIVGGSGGSSVSSVLKIEYVTKTPLTVTVNDKVLISYIFSGTDSNGDDVLEGMATWRVDGNIVATHTISAGENTFDITEYINVGEHKVTLTIADDAGSITSPKRWTVEKIDVRLESKFDDKRVYSVDNVSFDYTPYGAIAKDIYFILDGSEIGVVNTAQSGYLMSYDLPELGHGSHLLEAYMTATINNDIVESNHIYKDIIWYDSVSTSPIISCVQQNFTAKQYDTTNITYTVYDPTTEYPRVTLAVDGEPISTLTLDSNTQVWQYKSTKIGTQTLTITCGETVKTLIATIEELDIKVEPIKAGLAFDFDPTNYSNSSENRLWTDGDISMNVSDNFDWVNGGYQIDNNGDKYFCIKAGTSATINYQLFADDAKINGKEFKVVFKTTNIKNRDTSFISCMDNNIGLDMRVENAQIYSSNNNLYSPYCEEDIIEFEFNINKASDIPLVLTYEDGVGNRPMIYTSDASFWQTNPQPITIGSEKCDVHIYRMKAYTRSLSDSDILSNFIADARNADEMVKRYNRNQIYDKNNILSPEVLAEKCPDLRVIMIDAPWFTNDKDNKVEDTIVRMIYKNGDAVLDNWTCTGALHSGQGTSSNEYGYAGRNIDLIMDKDNSLFTLGDGKTTSKTITLTRNSVPTDYLNVKVNIASSENANNAQMARRYDMYNPFIRSAKFNDNKVKDCMEFYNCVIFIKERDTDISTHREFQDNNYHFYAIGNVGDSKKTDDTRVNDKNDPKEFILEITDYNVALAEFPTGNADGSICALSDWKAGNVAYDYLYSEYKYKEGKFKSFGSESYEFRYEMKGITEEQREVNINAWRELYKFIVTSSDEEFYSKLKEYFVVDSALYYYLFTERYTMVDNRAKNSFWHYGKVYITEEEAAILGDAAGGYIIDNEQAMIRNGYRFDLSFAYDMDTSLGIDNTGKLVLTYGKEDTDYYVDDDPSSAYIYRAAKSTFFCRLRDLFKSEMQGMFVNREDANAWSATSLINQWDNAQNQFPEELWRLNIQREYIRTYKGISVDNSVAGEANPRFLTEMMNGRKKYQRRMFERNQELYMATKYFGKTATQDQIMMRFNNPEVYVLKPNFTLYLTPYSNMYIGVKFGNVEAINFRAKAGVEYTIPYTLDTADITLIYGASFIQGIGDLSRCYVGDNDFSKASRLQRLVIGSDIDGYSNTYIKKIALGNNKLLEHLDIRKTTGLTDVIDLSQCGNLLELYAQDSGATGVIFANGGKIEKFYIPSVTSFTAKNLNYIEDFSIESYDNIQTLIVEYTPMIDTYDIVSESSKLQTLRLIDINWNIESTEALDRVLKLRGVSNDGSEIPQSVLSGYVHVPVIRQQQLYNYQKAWSDLEVVSDTTIEQFAVTFVNDDGTVLEVQYVDKGSNAIDPTTRTDNKLIPTKESSISHDYTFAGWYAVDYDNPLLSVFSDRTIIATYNESLRAYTIKYVSKGTTLQESSGLYGENVPYTGTTPTYTLEEAGYSYHLFNRWDKSGFVDGNKVVNAIFDNFSYTEGYFDGKDLKDLSPVEIYAMNKLGLYEDIVDDKDPYSFVIGNDIDYDDIESELIVSDTKSFTGSNYLDTGISLFDEDKDFVLAIDYEFLSGNTTGAILAQCFQADGSNGFKLWYNNSGEYNGVRFTWGTSHNNTTSINKREMVIVRHRKGENNLIIYNSNLDSDNVSVVELERTKSTIGSSTLVFGCAKADDGMYENHAIGNINWCKVWYKDLGDTVCRDLAMWTHEKITLEACGFRKYYLSDGSSKRCSFSLLASHLLKRNKIWSNSSVNAGGWGSSALNKSLNNRLYNAIPSQIKSLIKQVKVPSSIGSMSTDVETSDCYITVPAAIELDSTMTAEPYVNEGTPIKYMSGNEARKRAYDGGDVAAYWTRSPNAKYVDYVYQIDTSGKLYGFTTPSREAGVLIEISF